MSYNSRNKAIYPVTRTQCEMLDRCVHPDSKDDPRNSWVISSATLVRPRVDYRRLCRAYQRLQQRHDSLRIRFEAIKGNWRAVIGQISENPIKQVDLGELNDDEFHKYVVDFATATMPLIESPQSELILLKCGTRGDVVIWRVNESITDGYGSIVLTEDILKLLFGMPTHGRAVSHAEFLESFENAPPRQTKKFRAFWDEMHRNPPLAPNIGRKAKGLPPNLWNRGSELKRVTCIASQKSMDQLSKEIVANNNRFPSTMFSGFLEALCDTYDVEELLFSTNMARINPALANFAGHATLYPVLRYKASHQVCMVDAARRVNESLTSAMQNSPSHSLYKGTAHDQEMIAAGAYPRQFDCNHPRPSGLRERSVFAELLTSPAGKEIVFGGFRISALDLPEFNWAPYDMMFRIDDTKGNEGFHLYYDGISYDETEVFTLAHKACDLLRLEPRMIGLTDE